MNVIKYDEWDFTIDPETDERTYVDLEGKPLTGILEGFFYFKANDIRNDVDVVEGKMILEYYPTLRSNLRHWEESIRLASR